MGIEKLEQKKQLMSNEVLHLLMYGSNWQRFKRLFWEVVHNIKALIVFFAILPVLPIIYIIQAIRGELE